MDFSFEITYSLLFGWLLDLIFGDPSRLPHPIVYFGRWISFWEKRLNMNTHRKAKGAIFALISIAIVFALTSLITHLPSLFHTVHPSEFSCLPTMFHTVFPCEITTTIIETILIFFCLAGHTLRKEVRMVFEALDRSLEDGRRQVARIVGRDTQQLSAQEVRTAALETLAENLSDGVIAPLFWYAILGVPGMVTYKMINTLDSMIGYHNPRYKDFGCWAAHIDDIANYIPARITAFMMILVAWIMGKTGSTLHNGSLWQGLRFVFKYGPQHASPNSGWPEAALAYTLNCRFGGPHNYFGEMFYKPFIGHNERSLTTQDMRLSIRLCLIAEILCVAIAL